MTQFSNDRTGRRRQLAATMATVGTTGARTSAIDVQSHSDPDRADQNPSEPRSITGPADTSPLERFLLQRRVRLSDNRDLLTPFRPAIIVCRWGTTCLSLALSASAIADRRWAVIAWCAIVVSYTIFRSLVPVRFVDDSSGLVVVLVESAINVLAVAFTGYWESPLVFALLTAVIIAGFARGYRFALEVAAGSAIAVGIPYLATADADLRVSAQWAAELLLVALVAGYARRISGEVADDQSNALDRLSRLADANALLFSLHQVAQFLPASLDMGETLDQTAERVKDFFDVDFSAVLLFDETDKHWSIARYQGFRVTPTLTDGELPPPIDRAVTTQQLVHETSLELGDGLSPLASSGLYAPLIARGSIIGLLSLERDYAGTFAEIDVQLLTGFIESAALAIDNAHWFARLRIVGADEERNRIARDLHDRIGQSLAYLAFELDRLVRLERRGQPIGTDLERLRTDVRGVVREVRDTLYDLRSDVSETLDLVLALEQFVRRVRERSGMTLNLKGAVTGRLPMLQEREIFRIAQEAILNVERHAEATTVDVTLSCDGRNAFLEVADDGRGFAQERAGRLDSYGITGMRERAASIGAHIEIDTRPGEGTRVRCSLSPDGKASRLRMFPSTS